MVGGYPLLLFAGKVSVSHEQGTICVDGWIEFKAPVRVAVLFKELRGELDKLLMEKIERPEMDLFGGGTPEGQNAATSSPTTSDGTEGGSSVVGAGAKDVVSMIVRLLTSE
eukprot:CAMPEP_0118946564 /NCGR_PEP_ID=MMETSP1169-20130426/44426_1 /TAXON_ID=36882 /ORGANISM="Pyramimonas obovata, Strain CCMP722" /LENGTH=110 /DNA_ID=CAMNT_0006892565 /DNA_START=113 /DNA_END=442 /DNA_ORIENTATION=-